MINSSFNKINSLIIIISVLMAGCSKSASNPDPAPPPPTPVAFEIRDFAVDGISNFTNLVNVQYTPAARFRLSAPVNTSTLAANVYLTNKAGSIVPHNISLQNGDSVLVITPTAPLAPISRYILSIDRGLKSKAGVELSAGTNISILTKIDSSDKFPRISDDALLTRVQEQTFKYFWDFGHPVSGLARERNASNETVTSGGSGFGIMTIPVAINRNFISRAEGLARMQKIVVFLKNTAVKVKGAFPHWLNGTTGAIIPFSSNDNGADLVETSYLMMGLLTARQYFNGTDAAETNLRADINNLYNNVEWNWFRRGGQDVLYWHYSPDKEWAMNLPIKGWNESLITYILAASSPTHSIPASVYSNGWKNSNNYINGNTYYGYTLPLGPQLGGPLFFEHYTFMGVNPTGLIEGGINFLTQAKNHTLINYKYCVDNPKNWFGYSDSCWGLTASDIEGGYTASSPTNDRGFIAPTAALSSFPFTPAESKAALNFFYYKLGDKLFKEYGFVDAFSLHSPWFANSFLAIDQGPIIVMIENHRTGLLWNLFTSSPEVKAGMQKLGFTAPYL